VADLVDGPLRHTNLSAVAVTDWQGRAVGIVTMDAVRRVPAEQWAATTVAQLLETAPQPVQLAPGERLVEALERVAAGGGGHAVVVADGALVGLLGPEQVRRAIELGRLRGPRRRPAQQVSPPPPPGSVPQQRWEPPVAAG
jgi:predicted transcriptional regulator